MWLARLASRGAERFFDHVGVDRDRIVDAAGVPPGEIGGDRDGALARRAEDDPVARPQILARQLEPAQLVLLEWVRPGDIGNQVWTVALEDTSATPLVLASWNGWHLPPMQSPPRHE